MEAIKHGIKKIALGFIWLYQFFLSPWIGARCRFFPTCSEYMKEAIEARGLWVGVFLGIKRLGRCHRFCAGGYDPIKK